MLRRVKCPAILQPLNLITFFNMKFNVVISTFLQTSSILSLSWLQNFLQKERISLVLTSFNCSLSNPEIMNKALEQSLLKSSLEQISWASHLLAEFEGRKSRTWKLLNKSCDDKINVQYSYNLSYGIPASWRTFLYFLLGWGLVFNWMSRSFVVLTLEISSWTLEEKLNISAHHVIFPIFYSLRI